MNSCQCLRQVGTHGVKFGFGILTRDYPIRKWPRVKEHRSWVSEDCGVSSREFRMASMQLVKVLISSNVKICELRA